MRSFFLVALCCCVATTLGCATQYKSDGLTGGYEELALAPNHYRVKFSGNGYTSKERAYEFALLRCSELTLTSGYKYFGIADENEYEKRETFSTPTYYTTNTKHSIDGQVYPGGTYTATGKSKSTTYAYNFGNIDVSKPRAVVEIIMFKDEVPGLKLYDAAFLSNSIKRKYDIK